MKLSFSAPAEETVTPAQPAAPVKDTVAEVVPQALVPVESRAPATLPETYFEDDDASGEINNSRYESHPNIKIVSKTSAQAEEFGIGAWVIGSKTVEPVAVGKMDVPIKMVCVRFGLAWQEQIAYGEQRIPKMFATLAEAQAQGFFSEWGAEPRVAEVVKSLFWVPQPDGVEEPHIFSYESPEGPGALAFFFAARTTFGTVGKSLIQAKRSFLSTEKGGMVAGWWELTATKAARNGNTWLLPRIRPCGKTSPELQEFLKGLR
jgi:hypothetical protein